MGLIKREQGVAIVFKGEKETPERAVAVGDEVTLKTMRHSVQVRVEGIEADQYEGSVLKSGAYPEFQADDDIFFESDHIFECRKIKE